MFWSDLEDWNRSFHVIRSAENSVELLDEMAAEASTSVCSHIVSSFKCDKKMVMWYFNFCGATETEAMDIHQFLAEIYDFRQNIGDFHDYGLKPKTQAQGGFISRFALEIIEASPDEPSLSVQEYVTQLVDCYWRKLVGGLSHLSSTIKEGFNSAYRCFLKTMTASIFGTVSDTLLDMANITHKTIVKSASFFAFWVFIKLLGIVSDSVAHFMYNSIITGSKVCFFGQSDYDIMGLISAFAVGIIGVKFTDLSKIKTHVSTALALMAGGTIVVNSFKSFLTLLPAVLRTSLIYRFGSEDQRTEMELENWRAVGLSLNAVSRIQHVIGSQSYEKHVTDHINAGGSLIKKMPAHTKSGVRTAFTQTYARLVTIYTHIVTRKNNSGDRSVPFSFHVAGPPGIGKSSSTKDLIVQACDLSKDQIYNKDVSDEYFSGLMNHPAIVMDEWLVGPIEDKMVKGQMYLAMNSNTEWRPPFASVDDPNVGIKGSCCRPEVVVTINNQEYDRVDHSIDDAMQRRRRFVIRAKRSDKFVGQKGNDLNVDLSKYSDEEMRDRAWMKFDILPSMFAVRPTLIRKDLSYPQLVKFVRSQYESHKALMKRMDSNMNSSVIEDKTPDQIIDEVLRDTYNIPAAPLSIAEAIKSILTPVLFSQGPTPSPSEEDLQYSNVVVSEVQTTGALATILDQSSEEVEESIIQRIFNKVGNFTLSTIAGTTAALLVLIGVATSVMAGSEYVADTFYGQSAKTKNSAPKRTIKAPRHPGRCEGQGPQVYVVPLTVRNRTFNSVALGADWFLTYNHGLRPDELKDGEIISANVKGHLFDCVFKVETTYIYDDKDVVIFRLHNVHMPKFKNISKWFVSETEVDKLSNSQVVIDTERRMYTSKVVLQGNAKYYLDGGSSEVTLAIAAKYDAPTELGDCGLPVKVLSGPLVNKILGIHVAGTGAQACSPIGMASLVSREAIETVVCPVGAQGPNLVSVEKLQFNELVPVPCKTKFSKSCISEFLPEPTKKSPAIMSVLDPRANGNDPIEQSLINLFETEQMVLNQSLVDRIEGELFDKYEEQLEWPVGKRQLTFEEAGQGIPGIFNSIVTKTNAGYPLTHLTFKQGKTQFLWFEGTEMKCTDFYKELVLSTVKQMETYSGGPIDHKFLMFLKDEVLKQSKIDLCETRSTFCNSLARIHAFRMVFGATLIALSNNFKVTGFAVGFNQYSKDMNIFYLYLTEISERMVAGDYKKFDKRQQLQIQAASYSVFTRLAAQTGATSSQIAYLIQHETKSPVQIKDKLVTVKCANFSGCFLTTLINNLTNDFYLRYCFYSKYPELSFDDHVRAIKLGDDHILSIGPDVEMTPLQLSELMKPLGQTYTSAFKDAELRDEYDDFSEIMFLGAHPRRSLAGLWTGALRKETLHETPQWTRDHDGSLDQTIQGLVDCASQWDRDFFKEYVSELKQAYSDAGRAWVIKSDYTALHYNVLNRSADSGRDFPTFYCQGPVGIVDPTPVNHSDSLTQIVTDSEKQGNEGLQVNYSSLSGVITSRDASLDFGTSSYVRRLAFDWSSTSAEGTVLQTWNVPFDLLALGDKNSIQNMGFMNFVYSQPDVHVMFQVNGTPVQQGALVVWFAPFSNSDVPNAQLANWTCYDHIILTPNNNTSKEISISFNFFKAYLDNRRGFTVPKSQAIGTLHVGVLTPLTTLTLPTTASVAVYTKFASKFKLPRARTVNGQGPVESEEYWLDIDGVRVSLTRKEYEKQMLASHPKSVKKPHKVGSKPISKKKFSSFLSRMAKSQKTKVYVGQGATYSTSNITNDYHIGSVGGDMPNQSSTTARNSQSTTADVGLPLDNPPLSGGALPTYRQFSSMSKALGVEPTVSLQMDQMMLHRQPESFRDKRATTISYLAGRRGYSGWTTVSTTDAAGTNIQVFEMSSMPNYLYPGTVPANQASLNQFARWRGDITMEIFCAKTVFHSLRLQIIAAYGISYTTLSAENSPNSYPNEVIEFSGDEQWARVVFPFQAPTEFLNTRGPASAVTQFEQIMGTISYNIANPLKVSSSVVANSVKLLTFFSFDNVSVYEPRTGTYVSLGDTTSFPVIVAQGPIEIGATGDRAGDDETQIEATAEVASHDLYPEKRVCKRELGHKFDYLVRDITEIGRRHYFTSLHDYDGYSYETWGRCNEVDADYSTPSRTNINVHSIYVYPKHPICQLYQGWSGHLKYRIFVATVASTGSNQTPGPITVSHIATDARAKILSTAPESLTIPGPAGTLNANNFPGFSVVPGPAICGRTGTSTGTFIGPTTYCYKNAGSEVSAPIEVAMAQSVGLTTIDVSVPFNTVLNVLPTQPSYYTDYFQPYNGKLCIALPAFTSGTYTIQVYQAFGDDFRLHGFNPNGSYSNIGYTTSGGPAAPSGGVQIGGVVFGDS